MSTVSKTETNKKVMDYIQSKKTEGIEVVKNVTKLAIDSLVMPKWEELGIFSFMHKQVNLTAEAPTGCEYDPDTYQSVLRVINGQVLWSDERFKLGKRADTYCWKTSKVNDLKVKGRTESIGITSAEGLVALSNLLTSIKDEEEKLLVATTFKVFNTEMLVAHEQSSERRCFIVTEDFPLSYIVDEWMDEESEPTEVFVGDAIIVTENEDGTTTFYRVDKDIFELTYSF